MPGLDGDKMSKSYENTIRLREEPNVIEQKIRTMKTDPARVRRDDPGNPRHLPCLCAAPDLHDDETRAWAAEGCRTAGIGCLECKGPLIDAIKAEQAADARTRAAIRTGSRPGPVPSGGRRPKSARRRTGDARRSARGDRHLAQVNTDVADQTALVSAQPNANDASRAVVPGDRLRALREQRSGEADELYAIVGGEAVTELPTDLYIPPDALEVFLETFEGPLDLLLYLIRRQNLDILDINVAEITRQYMQYIETDDGAAVGTRRGISRDGCAAGRNQIADAAAAAEFRSRRRRRSARAAHSPAAGIRTLQRRGGAAGYAAAARARRVSRVRGAA